MVGGGKSVEPEEYPGRSSAESVLGEGIATMAVGSVVTTAGDEALSSRMMTKSIMSRAEVVPLRERYRVRRVGLAVK